MESDNVWVEAVGVAVAAIAAIVALRTYSRDVKHKQTHWLYELFEDFYKNDIYIGIRQTLTMGSTDTKEMKINLQEAREALTSQHTPQEFIDIADDICDYLNFFEFVCNLVRTDRMKRQDMDSLFDYYLDNLAEHDFIMEYLSDSQHGFEALASELWTYHRDKVPRSVLHLAPKTPPAMTFADAMREIGEVRPMREPLL